MSNRYLAMKKTLYFYASHRTVKDMETNIAIMMADLSGYTAMTEIHGADSAVSIIDKYLSIVKKSLVGSSRLHERVGDEMIIVADTAEDLAYTATFLFEHAYNENEFLPLHAGIHYGPIVKKDGDYFGSTINTASRITSVAQKGQIVCSAEFLNQLPKGHPYIVSPKGMHTFKNLLKPVELFQMSCCIEYMSKKYVIDPVCHMLIKTPETALQLLHEEELHYFCSENCFNMYKTLNNIS
jgi:class 3 adenylate cyclase/YHS domain-containing protein